MRTIQTVVLLAVLAVAAPAVGGDDPSIQGATRDGVQAAMNRHIESHTIDGRYVMFDGPAGRILRLDAAKLHAGIVKKGDFYVSCADFKNGDAKLDVDFLVAETGGTFIVADAIVHKVNGEKRPYAVD